MTPETVIVCPELQAGSGGLADYTLRVAENWPSAAPLRFVVPTTERGELPSLPPSLIVTPVERQSRALLAALPPGDGAVLLQYSAYGFDQLGYPRWLLRGLLEWKKRSRGLLAIMFHEIWTFWPVLNKNYFVQQLHRRDIRKLLAEAEAIFTSTSSQAEHLRALRPASHIEVLPVGSNVRRISPSPRERDPGVAVLFGLQRTRRRALQAMQADLHSLAQQNCLAKVITIGAGSAEAERERGLLDSLKLSAGFEQRGQTVEEELSELLLTAQFGISNQDDLSVTKSGTFMAYAAHGLDVISPSAGRTKPEPFCWLIAPSELLRGIAPNELRDRAERLRLWQEAIASWPRIAAQFARALHGPEFVSSTT